MRTLDLVPLFRGSVGFDRIPSLFDSIQSSGKHESFPPYNIELVEEDKYVISMAVAGFKTDEIDVTSEQNNLVITGTHKNKTEKSYLYQGIAERNFVRRFEIADFVKITSANLQDGILTITLLRELPEAMKSRKIEVQSGKLIANN